MSTQALQPLTWLARRWTSSSVACGTPPRVVAFIRPWIDCIAPGRTIAGFFIRACTVISLRGLAGRRRTVGVAIAPNLGAIVLNCQLILPNKDYRCMMVL